MSNEKVDQEFETYKKLEKIKVLLEKLKQQRKELKQALMKEALFEEDEYKLANKLRNISKAILALERNEHSILRDFPDPANNYTLD